MMAAERPDYGDMTFGEIEERISAGDEGAAGYFQECFGPVAKKLTALLQSSLPKFHFEPLPRFHFEPLPRFHFEPPPSIEPLTFGEPFKPYEPMDLPALDVTPSRTAKVTHVLTVLWRLAIGVATIGAFVMMLKP